MVSPRPKLTDVRRRQILEAAGHVIAERGLGETRVADIADVIGVSPALVMYYFESKDGLLGEALAHKDRQFFESVSEAMASQASPTERLVTLIRASCPSLGDGASVDEDYVLWMEAWSRSRHDRAVARARHEMDARWRATMADVVREGQAAGEFDADVDPEEFALKITALIDGLAIQVVLGDEDVGPADMLRLCLDVASEDLVAILSEPVEG